MKFSIILITITLFLFSCQEEKNKSYNTNTIKVFEANGYVVPKDSMAEPKVILVDESKLKKIPAGKPTNVATNLNVHPVGIPKIVLAGKPRVCTPGQDTFLLPKTVPVIDSSFISGIPETVIAKDMASKDRNPQNFNTYGKLQGLKHGSITCLLEDKSGNLWFGTAGGGVSKYDGNSFTHFTNKEGLSNNDIRSMVEDKSGNLWFGTFGGGVSKFDGKKFTHFTEKEGLSNNFVWTVVEDKSGNLWFGTNGGGVSKYDGKCFTHFTEKEGLTNNNVRSILEDKSGNLWFGTSGGGVSKYDGNCVDDIINETNLYQNNHQDRKNNKKSLVKIFTHFTEKEGLSNNDVLSILEDKSGNLWFGTFGGGVSKYNGNNFTHFTNKEGLSNNVVLSILEDRYGDLWFGTNGGGVSKYTEKSITHFTVEEGLSNNVVLSILEDKSGNLWFGTYGSGVSKYDGKCFAHFTENEGLSNKVVWSIVEDKSGNLWFGTFGGGVSKYDGNVFSHFTDKEGLSNNDVLSMLEDKSGNLWFGTNGGGVSKYDGKIFTHFTDKDGLSNNLVWSMVEDKSGNLWFGTDGGGVTKYNGNCVDDIINETNLYQHNQQDLKKNKKALVKSFTHFTVKAGLSNNVVRSMLVDRFGNLWFGTAGGGVSKYDGKSFTHFTDKNGLSNNDVRSMVEDKSGNLWFGTNGSGISKYDGKKFTHFTVKEGLSNNVVFSILEDKSGNLWFGTRFGLSKLTKNKLAEINQKVKANTSTEQDVIFKNYSYADGFSGNSVNGGKTMLQASDGSIWIATNDRLSVMFPEKMQADTIAPNIQLTTIELFNENISWINLDKKKDTTLKLGNGVIISDFEFDGLTKWHTLPENLSLTYDNNYLTFNFVGITMNQPKNVKYQYILEGLDENWSAITNKTSAPYGNLPHGTYTFKVKAMNSEGYWSAPFEYKFTIRPPFWKTWWFRTLIGLIIISSIWFYIKSREKKLVARQKELEQKIEIATEDIKGQKHIIEEKHKEITDSINYAERIQRSFLATKEHLNSNLNEYFILFKPKDVVSGDFYWSATLNNGLFALVTADSTGHGVPGAIMSLLNIGGIEKAIETYTSPADILNSTRKTIIERLKKDGSPEGGKDGMDASLCVYDFKNKKLTISAANNPVWIIRGPVPFSRGEGRRDEAEVIEVKPDKMPIGKHDRDNISFTHQEIDLQSGDVIYTLTDGFPDQFGGANGKKFMSKNLREMLAANAHLPMHEQKQLLEQTFANWLGNMEQVDDVTLIGVRI